MADPAGCAVYGAGLWLHACWDCGFEFRRGREFLSVVCVVCCQVGVSATGFTRPEESCSMCVCVCVSYIVIRCNNNLYTYNYT
jgi:hypothetical protein